MHLKRRDASDEAQCIKQHWKMKCGRMWERRGSGEGNECVMARGQWALIGPGSGNNFCVLWTHVFLFVLLYFFPFLPLGVGKPRRTGNWTCRLSGTSASSGSV